MTWVSAAGGSGKVQNIEVVTDNVSKGGLYDVAVTNVPSFTDGRIVILISSKEIRHVEISVFSTVVTPCSPKCAHGTCDMTKGSCICDEGYFGDDCSILHSKWMKTQVPKNPLLLIPGIGGSRIIAENKFSGI